jgi:hypothetical protein
VTVPSARARPAPSRPARLADRRGLTALGAVLFTLLVGVLGGAADVLTGPGLREVFAIAFLSACLLSAISVHREDLAAVVVMPPLVYAALVLVAGLAEGGLPTGSLLLHQAIELFNGLVLGAPVLVAGTAMAAGVALIRRAAR